MRTRVGPVRIEERSPRSAEPIGDITSEEKRITLTLRGSRAPAGIDLLALDGFIKNFLAALRDFDRHERGEPARKTGTPDALASAATALRLVSLRAGCAVAELEPITAPAAADDAELPLGDVPRARFVIDRLLDRIEGHSSLPVAVAQSLENARRACGDDGSFELSTTTSGRQRSVMIDAETIGKLRTARLISSVTSISGRLSRLGESPDKAVIRSPDGTEWNCDYSEELADTLAPLWRRNVYATGDGERTSSRRGAFRITQITPLLDDAQTELFKREHVGTDELLAEQGIEEPQGLARVASDTLFSDEVEGAYLAAVFGDDE